MKTSHLVTIFLLVILIVACNEEEQEVYDYPFVHINYENSSSVSVSSKGTLLREYNVYLSSKPFTGTVTVGYKIILGNGLTEGKDFELITEGFSLNFLPGIYEMPIRIKWLANEINPEENNTVTILLTDNNMGITIGYPGPERLESKLVITKTP
jgi:hypothetical protein